MSFLNRLNSGLEKLNSYFTDYAIVILLVGAGIYFTFRLKFVQIRYFITGIKNAFGGAFKGNNSSYSALATAVAAQIGTGNIVGAASAILIGGAGAVFWMWVVAFFGMATVYAEAVLAQEFAVVESGVKRGGPVYYIIGAFKGKTGKIAANVFAVATVISLSFSGTMVQSNATALSAASSLNIHPVVVGALISLLCAIVYLGGAEKLMKLTEKLVPIMTILFILGCFIVLIVRVNLIDDIIKEILSSAFRPRSVAGCYVAVTVKQCISQGVKKGLFSNEAGMGSTPHAHATAKVKSSHDQGCVAMIGVFIDTFVVLTLTAFVMLSYTCCSNKAVSLSENNLMRISFEGVLGVTSSELLLSISLFLFAFTSIISWNYFGRLNFEYLFQKKNIFIFYVLSVIFTFFGSLFNNKFVWNISDFSLIFMILPNVFAVLKNRKIVISVLNRAK